jgi:hypothetical protein
MIMVDRLRSISPSADEVVLAKVTSHDLAERLTEVHHPAAAYARKVAELARHEPYLWRGILPPDP